MISGCALNHGLENIRAQKCGTSVHGGCAQFMTAHKTSMMPLLNFSPTDQAANLGWNWSKAEKFDDPSAAKGADSSPSYHGSFGPVNVAFAQKMYGGPQQKASMAKFGLVQSRD